MKPASRRWIGLTLGGAGLMVLAWASLIPLDSGSLPSRHDKLAHLAAYGTMGAWFGLFIPLRRWFPLWVALGVFGLGIEFAQESTGYRSFDRWDVLTNGAGAALGLALLAGPRQLWLRIDHYWARMSR
jgi:VanZ family protein